MMDEQPNQQALSSTQFDAVAAGYGDGLAIEALAGGQHSKWLMTLGSILEAADSPALDPALDLLERARLSDGEALATVLTYPHNGVWATVCLEALMGVNGELSDDHLSHLNAIAAVAAFVSGVDNFAIDVPVVNGCVDVPGFGRVIVGNTATALLTSAGGTLTLVTDDVVVTVGSDGVASPRETENWQPLRVMTSTHKGHAIAVLVDDVSRYRHFYLDASKPIDRLTMEEFDAWARKFDSAWKTIAVHHWEYATSISAGLRCIVPLQRSKFGVSRGSASGFGAIGVDDAYGDEWFAFRLLNQFQQSKLDALHDLVPLHTAAHDEFVYLIPSRFDDMSSLREVLEALYKGIVAVEFWENQRNIEQDAAKQLRASAEFVTWHARVPAFGRMLFATDELTKNGVRVVEGVLDTHHKRWPQLDVRPELEAIARLVEVDIRMASRLRLLTFESTVARELADYWCATLSCPTETVHRLRPVVVARRGAYGHLARRTAVFAVASGKTETLSIMHSEAEVAFAHGRFGEAIDIFRAHVQRDPDDLDGWSGFVTSTIAAGARGCATVERFPELVQAVYSEIANRRRFPPDPADVSVWLEPLLPHVQDP